MKRVLCMLGLSFAVCGCTAVYTQEPVGESPANITDSQDQWGGTWVCDDAPVNAPSAVAVRVVDSTNGLLRIAWVENQSLEPRKADVLLRTGGGRTYATLRMLNADGGEATNIYFWARLDRHGNSALAWPPDGGKFAKRVKDGLLTGVVTNNRVIVGPLGSNDFVRFNSRTNDVLFNWEHPFVLRKAGR